MTEYLKLKKSNCVNCYKCIRHCPVKSIKFSSDQAQIVSDVCILCGQCFVVCPQNAKEIRNDIDKASALIRGSRVIASVAPSFVANYPGATIKTLEKALRKLGFESVEETAIGVLTFEELSLWLQREDITVEAGEDHLNESKARLFPTSGGILRSMLCDSKDYTYLTVDGIDNCIAALNDIKEGRLKKCFIEMSICAGSCIGGPAMERNHRLPVRDYIAVDRYAGKEDFQVSMPEERELIKDHKFIGLHRQMPGQSDIEEILHKMGKHTPDQELNCGACGYNTCRDKAVAVYLGKANISMCLPFLKDKAESFSDTIINNTPNGIIVLNEALEVQQINSAARKIMNIRNASDVLGDQVIRILDPKVFLDVMQTGRSIHDEKVYLAEYQKYVEQSVIYDKSYRIVMCIMRDVTEEEHERIQKEKISQHTIEVTDRVIEKQMRVVQEIASLLGETTAETKIALTNLKDSLNDE